MFRSGERCHFCSIWNKAPKGDRVHLCSLCKMFVLEETKLREKGQRANELELRSD